LCIPLSKYELQVSITITKINALYTLPWPWQSDITSTYHGPSAEQLKSSVQKVQRSDLDELDADHDLIQDQFEEIEFDAEIAPSMSSACGRELVWKSQKMIQSLSKK
jgi:hypothetical protein